MKMKNGVLVMKIVVISTDDLDLIEDYGSDSYPFAIWVDKEMANETELANFLEYYTKELNMLLKGEIDYIVIEYDR